MTAALAEDLVLHAGFDRLNGLFPGLRHGDALPQGQTVRLDHSGDGGSLQILQGLFHIVKDLILRRGDAVFLHQVLGEDFTAFQDGGGFIGTETGDPDSFQPIHRAQDQGIVRSDHRKINGIFLGEGSDAVQVLRAYAGADRISGDAAVPRRGKDLRYTGAFFQALDDGVLPSATAYDQNFHGVTSLSDGTAASR